MMKNLLPLIFIVALFFSIAQPLTGTAATVDNAADGFYKLEGEGQYIPFTKFLFMTTPERIAILTGNYYFITEGVALKTIEILQSKTDAILDSKKISQSELEKVFKVIIGADGSITPGERPDGDDFFVENIE